MAAIEDMDSLRAEVASLKIENSIHRNIAIRGRRRINLLEALLKEIPSTGIVTPQWLKKKDEVLGEK